MMHHGTKADCSKKAENAIQGALDDRTLAMVCSIHVALYTTMFGNASQDRIRTVTWLPAMPNREATVHHLRA